MFNRKIVETILLASLFTFVLSAFGVDFSIYPKKLSDLDENITRILNSSNLNKSDAADLVNDLQSYVFHLGPLTNVLLSNIGVEDVAKTVYLQGRPAFLYVTLQEDLIQQTFRWNDNQMKVLHFLYDNAERQWNLFVEEFGKLNITI